MILKPQLDQNKIDINFAVKRYQDGPVRYNQARRDVRKIITTCYNSLFDRRKNWTEEERVHIGKAYHAILNEDYSYAIQFFINRRNKIASKPNWLRKESDNILLNTFNNLVRSFEENDSQSQSEQ